MNASTLNNSRDMGKDGAATGYLTSNNTVHGYFAKDVTAYTLGYYDQDYKAAGSSTMEATYTGPTAFGDGATNLYNGNIRHLVTSIQGMTTLGHTYRYDQLQRLKSVNTFYLTGTGLTNNSWSGMTATPEYNSSYTYDPNGNLLTLNRNAYGAQLADMDKLIYQYDTNPVTGKRWNRLRNAKETGNTYMTGSTPSYDDIRGGNNYFFYDKLGQLTKDSLNGIASVRWRLGDKKALVINHVAANAPQVKFIYDPFGRRIAKIVTPKSNKILQANRQFTYYALDANGQEMAVYTANINTSSPTQNTATLDEHYLYGASRLGVRDAAKAMYNNGPVNYAASSYYKNTLGKRNYELSNYLGNVQAVITDRRTYSAGNYLATLVMSADYYAFGMAMPGRTFNSASYRYGYNGMEKDDEVKSGGNSYTTEFRQYDPRVGRWLSLDPLMSQFSDMSPYVSFNNNPIFYTDPFGLSSMGPLEPEIVEPSSSGSKDLPESDGTMFSWKGNTRGGKWLSSAANAMKKDLQTKYALEKVMHLATVRRDHIINNYKNYSKGDVDEDMRSTVQIDVQYNGFDEDGDTGFELLMSYKTSKEHEIIVQIPLYRYSRAYNDHDVQMKASLTKITFEELKERYTNCFADALGMIGIIGNPQRILDDDYKPSKERKIGDVGMFSLPDEGNLHAIRIIGKKNGQWIYRSNWLQDDSAVEGTWDVILRQMEDHGMGTDYNGNVVTPANFKWYEKK